MKPLRLVMEAFGPFCGRHELDFRDLGARTLFLVEGDTGSGKTTIFDAMCVALYGKTSVGRSQEHMKCLSAAAEAQCRVEFEFEVGARSFRVERIPEQERPARRGSGTTKQPHTATLWETTTGETRVLASKLGDVAEQITRILGLSAEQFCQVVLLPQGRFEKMLKAPASERESVMKVLFQTDRYAAIQERLVANWRAAEAEVEKLLVARGELLAACACTQPEELHERCLQRESELATAQAGRQVLADGEIQARVQLQAGQEIARKIGERDKAQTAFNELASLRPSIDSQRSELERADRAQRLAVTDANLAEARKRHVEMRDDLAKKTRLRQDLEQQKDLAVQRLRDEEARLPEHDKARTELHALEVLATAVADLAVLRKHLTTANKAAAEAAQKVKAEEDQLAKGQDALDAADKRNAELKALADGRADRERVLKAVEDAAARAEKVGKVRASLATAKDSLEQALQIEALASQGLQEAKDDLVHSQHAWIEAQASALAQALETGAPCPVCGSCEHPRPAHVGATIVDRSALDAQLATVSRLEEQLAKARQATEILKIRVATLTAEENTLAGDTAALQPNELADARKRVEEARAACQALVGLGETISRLQAQKLACESRLAQSKATAEQVEGQRSALAGQVVLREKDVPAQLRDPAALSCATGAAKEKLEMLLHGLEKARALLNEANEKHASQARAVAEAQSALELLVKKGSGLREQLERELSAQGFASLDDYNAAKRGHDEIAKLRTSINDFETKLKAAQVRLEQTTAAATGLTKPDVAELESIVERAKNALRDADTRIGALNAEFKTLRDSAARLKDLQRELGERDVRSQALQRLARAATGSEPRNPGFHRFVLAERLDEVLLAANRRLGPMSHDRYVLGRVRTEEDQRVTAGLNLEVLDGYSGRARPIDTLSGGESFQAALALALGLADVVQQHAGGVKLDTVFIDEGFGSLDPNALELAMQCLENLRQSGRLVGVISHVAEMKERIRDAQLRVTNQRGVSTVEFAVR